MATPAGIVVVVHGGREVSTRPVTAVDLPVLRMIPVARAIQRAVWGTRPSDTWAYAGRARAVTSVTALEIRGGDHPMLRRANLWHAVAAEFARMSFGLPAGQRSAAVAVRAPGVGEAGWITLV